MPRPQRIYTNHYPSPTEAINAYLVATGTDRQSWGSVVARILGSRNARQADDVHHRVHQWLRWWESAGLTGNIHDPANLRAFLLAQGARTFLSEASYKTLELCSIKAVLRATPGISYESVEVIEQAQYEGRQG